MKTRHPLPRFRAFAILVFSLWSLVLGLAPQAHAAAASRAAQETAIDSTFPSNEPGAITAAKLRTITKQIVDSAYNSIDDGAPATQAALDLRLPTSLRITYTGRPQSALVLPLAAGVVFVPSAAVGGQAVYTASAGPTIFSFSYTESGVPGYQLLTLSFDDLAGTALSFTPSTMAALTTLSLPALVSVSGGFSPATMASLTTLSIPALVSAGGSFSPAIMAALTTLSAPALVSVGGAFSPNNMASLTTLSIPALVSVGGAFSPNNMASLTALSAPALVSVGGSFNPNTMAACTSVSAPAMVTYGSTISISTSGMGNVSSLTLGTVGTLKTIAGATITLSGLALPSANVNAILALLVSLDGTNGTTLWGSGKTLTINAGTNGAPTGQGVTDKATLQARGATITTN